MYRILYFKNRFQNCIKILVLRYIGTMYMVYSSSSAHFLWPSIFYRGKLHVLQGLF